MDSSSILTEYHFHVKPHEYNLYCQHFCKYSGIIYAPKSHRISYEYSTLRYLEPIATNFSTLFSQNSFKCLQTTWSETVEVRC